MGTRVPIKCVQTWLRYQFCYVSYKRKFILFELKGHAYRWCLEYVHYKTLTNKCHSVVIYACVQMFDGTTWRSAHGENSKTANTKRLIPRSNRCSLVSELSVYELKVYVHWSICTLRGIMDHLIYTNQAAIKGCCSKSVLLGYQTIPNPIRNLTNPKVSHRHSRSASLLQIRNTWSPIHVAFAPLDT